MLSQPPYLGHPGADKQSAPPSTATRAVHDQLIDLLDRMLASPAASPLDCGFLRQYRDLLRFIGAFQDSVLMDERRTPSCRRGCTACCMHWVEDVYSFEAVIIADHLRRCLPQRVTSIVAQCRSDMAMMEALDEEVHHAMRRSKDERKSAAAGFDHVDLLLAAFYRQRRPCPLLDRDGGCMVYALRPITCRVYVSFSPPAQCDPDHADEHDIPTVLLDLEEEASERLDRLHTRHDRFDNDTSLRSLLATILGDIADR